MGEQLAGLDVVIIASFLLAFKAILIEGSEVAILSLAVTKQIGRRNVLLGVALGGLGSIVTFLIVEQAFLTLKTVSDALINLIPGVVILYFSYRFLRGFVKYYFRGKSFRAKMEKWSDEVVEKDRKHSGNATTTQGQIPFSVRNSLPVFSITMTEGFEASLILAAAGAFNIEWTLIGALASLILLIVVCAFSYDYLMQVPRWALDLIAGLVLLSFGSYFFISGILIATGVIS
ncbi:MAG: hypothetical protein AUI93_00585 [Crenarchaeota archaeon 13_1_40CM_3_52_10]|nr:MAG: hypothetical protein AUI93_00585 [Crenarchaeota archaeon 13_1_40CM_3_52_10]